MNGNLSTATPGPVDLPAHHTNNVPGRRIVALCGGILALLIVWMVLFPYTGEPDAVLHYLDGWSAVHHVPDVLNAWSRPAYILPLAPFTLLGRTAARLYQLALFLVLVWQTIRLAEDLNIPHALLAGAMLIWQPEVFTLASDTLTEVPMALALVCAVRLWLKQRKQWSGLIVGFLPLIRPEGFYVGVLWGLMVLFAPALPWRRRLITLVVMSAGMLAWTFACWIWTHDPLWFAHQWNWAMHSSYARGPIYHFLLNWPAYCGWPLCVLFITGIISALRRSIPGMWLLQTLWLLVFVLHSLLFWGGWFDSVGILRVLVCTAPITAIICLIGYNAFGTWLTRMTRPTVRRAVTGAGTAACTISMLVPYCLLPRHYDCFPLLGCARYIQDHHLLGPQTQLIAGNRIINAELGIAPYSPLTCILPCDADGVWTELRRLPLGSIVVWDNRQAVDWHRTRTEHLLHGGFTLIHEETFQAPPASKDWLPTVDMRYVVLRKDAPTPEKRPEIHP